MTRILSLILVSIGFLTSGCLTGSGGSSDSAQSSSSTGGSPAAVTPSPTPTPGSGQNISCVDTTGARHADGATWLQILPHEEYYFCANAVRGAEKIYSTQFICINGVISPIGTQIAPNVNATPIAGCVEPTLSASINPTYPIVDTLSQLQITSSGTTSVTYSCVEQDSGVSIADGSTGAGIKDVTLAANGDFNCNVSSLDTDGTKLNIQLSVPVNCGNKLRVGHHCEDYTCKTVQTLAAGADGIVRIPERSGTDSGECYSMKLISAIANSASNLTTVIDPDIVSRNHDVKPQSPDAIHNAYQMGRAMVNFNVGGSRVVKIAGGASSTTPILVDNFVVRGLYPMGTNAPGAQYFAAYGTSDSSVRTTGGVLFQDQVVLILPFATGGTSTVAPLDLNPLVVPGQDYTLDVRALDCGGSRELSDIYLIFQ